MPFVPGLPAPSVPDSAPGGLGPPTALLVTADPWIREQVLTAAESVGAVVRLAGPRHPDAFWWARAQLVLLGPDTDPDGLPGPRAGLVLLTQALVPVPAGAPGGEQVCLPEGQGRLAELLAQCRADAGALVIGLIGSVGGAGASTLACALALGAPAGEPCLLVDGDPLGPGLQTPLGWEEVAGARWPDLDRVQGRLRPGALAAALPARGDLMILSYDRGSPALPQGPGAHRLAEVLDAARLDCPRIVLDLPRRCEPGDLLVWHGLGAAVVVTTGTVAGVFAASRLVETLRGLCPKVAVVVRPGGLSAAEVEPVVTADLVLDWAGQRGLAAAAEAGDLGRALRRGGGQALARRLWAWAA